VQDIMYFFFPNFVYKKTSPVL